MDKTLESILLKFNGPFRLKLAYGIRIIPNKPGVYCLFLNGQIMKFGKADNLRRRMGDYCGYNEAYITKNNIDNVIVMWKVHPKEKCRLFEKALYTYAKHVGEELPWSERC